MTSALGWVGCAFLLISLAQSNTLRLRLFNLVACVILVVYNLAIGAEPPAATNALLAAVNLWRLMRLLRVRARPADPAATALDSMQAPSTLVQARTAEIE